MRLGLLDKKFLIISLTLLVTTALFLFLISIEKSRKEVVLRLIAIERSIASDKLVPQGQMIGLDISVIKNIFEEDVEPTRFLHKKENAVGIYNVIPAYYSGHEICELTFSQDNGVLFIWYLEGSNEIIWDAFVKDGLKF